MRNNKIISFSLFISFSTFIMSCGTTSVSVKNNNLPQLEYEKKIQKEEPLVFEEVVDGKIWYTELETVKDDLTYGNLYQIKLKFDTESKTFEKETYKLQRHGNSNTYKAAGYSSQNGIYYFGENKEKIIYQITKDYDVNVNSTRINNVPDQVPKVAEYTLESKNTIVWEGNRYYSSNDIEDNYFER